MFSSTECRLLPAVYQKKMIEGWDVHTVLESENKEDEEENGVGRERTTNRAYHC